MNINIRKHFWFLAFLVILPMIGCIPANLCVLPPIENIDAYQVAARIKFTISTSNIVQDKVDVENYAKLILPELKKAIDLLDDGKISVSDLFKAVENIRIEGKRLSDDKLFKVFRDAVAAEFDPYLRIPESYNPAISLLKQVVDKLINDYEVKI